MHAWVEEALPMLDRMRVREGQYLLFSDLESGTDLDFLSRAKLNIRGYLLLGCPDDCRLIWNTPETGRQRETRLTPLSETNRWLYQRLLQTLWRERGSDVEQLRQSVEASYPAKLYNLTSDGWRDSNAVKIPIPALGVGVAWKYDPYISVGQWIGIFVLGMGILLIGVYWLSHEFDARLQALVQATSRLAHGQLKTRVRLTPGDLFSSLGESFNRMAQHIQRLIEVQREMIRAVSHELRTPVARVRFGLQMIEDYLDDDYVLKQVTAIDGDIQELDELVDEILTYARLEEGGPVLEFKLANIEDLLDQIVRETLRRNPKVAVWKDCVEGMGDPVAEIEQRYLHRAIQNLVGNACRHAKAQVCINFYCTEDLCRVEVEDDGSGIPEEDWERVFSPFARLDDSRTRASGGYGLGLSIVRRVAYWHGGRAAIDRSRWGGAKFSLIWPRYHQSGGSLT